MPRFILFSLSRSVSLVSFFFFFQAEDGIRDYKVTGVQTCALPICAASCSAWRSAAFTAASRASSRSRRPAAQHAISSIRSEERRVGKECRSRRSPYHEKKKAERTEVKEQQEQTRSNGHGGRWQ